MYETCIWSDFYYLGTVGVATATHVLELSVLRKMFRGMNDNLFHRIAMNLGPKLPPPPEKE